MIKNHYLIYQPLLYTLFNTAISIGRLICKITNMHNCVTKAWTKMLPLVLTVQHVLHFLKLKHTQPKTQ